MKFQIKGRFDGLVKAEVEIECATNDSNYTQLGKAVVTALRNSADLRGTNLYGADLCGADLRSADLGGADLRGANLYGADLGGADLRSADLRSADLYGTNLYGADLRSANLGGADLRSADLRGANLGGADLRGANLYGADLGGEVSKVTKLLSFVMRSDGHVFLGFLKEDGTLGIVAGCQNRTLASYRKHVRCDYTERSNGRALAKETTAILDFLSDRCKIARREKQ